MITLCIALHLYSGPIAVGTPVTVASESCRRTAVKAASKAIATCARQGALACEVLIAPDRSRVTLENKISVAR
jgi:hypothetical protein